MERDELKFEHHSDEEALELYALGRLDETNAETVEEHILICEQCRVRLDEADRYVHAMQLGAARLRSYPKVKVAGTASWSRFRDFFNAPLVGWATVALAVLVAAIQLTNPLQRRAPAAIALVAERGEVISAPAHRLLSLDLDARDLSLGSKARVEVVDADGKTIETVTAPEIAAKVEVRTTRELKPGSYYVRLYAPGSREVIREFGLEVK